MALWFGQKRRAIDAETMATWPASGPSALLKMRPSTSGIRHRREVARADGLVVGVRVARLRLGRLAFDGEGIVPANRVGQGAQQHQAGRVHAGQRRQAVEQRTVEGGARLVIGIAVAELDLGRDDARRDRSPAPGARATQTTARPAPRRRQDRARARAGRPPARRVRGPRGGCPPRAGSTRARRRRRPRARPATPARCRRAPPRPATARARRRALASRWPGDRCRARRRE